MASSERGRPERPAEGRPATGTGSGRVDRLRQRGSPRHRVPPRLQPRRHREPASAPSSIESFDDSVARLTIVEDDSIQGSDRNRDGRHRPHHHPGAIGRRCRRDLGVLRVRRVQPRPTVLASDPISDVAVLKVPSSDGRPTEVGGQPRIGHRVVAVHNVAGGEARIRSGVIGSTGLDLMRADGVMQRGVFVADCRGFRVTDDGVVFDDSGRFVGLAIALPTAGRGLAAVSAPTTSWRSPSSCCGPVTSRTRGSGSTGSTSSDTTAQGVDLTGGAEVTSVAQDSPAASAGVRAGDVDRVDAGRAGRSDDRHSDAARSTPRSATSHAIGGRSPGRSRRSRGHHGRPSVDIEGRRTVTARSPASRREDRRRQAARSMSP